MPELKLIALDSEDLGVISAHLQDAVVRVADLAYLKREKRFAALLNRFVWERRMSPRQQVEKPGPDQRRRSGLRFERVLGAQLQGIDLADRKAVLSLLAVSFSPTLPDAPDGDVTLTFSGGAAIRLRVECLEAELKDLGAAWAAKAVPTHPSEGVADKAENKR